MMELLCMGMGGEICTHVRPCLESAAGSLDMAADFISFEIIADDLPGAEEPWLRLEPSNDLVETRVKGILFCSESCFCATRKATSTVFPPVEIWDQAPAPKEHKLFDASCFSQSHTEIFLHHELLLARDIVRGEVLPGEIPTSRVEAFSACWAVVIDGRLARMGLPGYSLAHRRSSFSRLFACSGVLLPSHWQIFQSLWDGGVDNWKDVLASNRHLPSL